MSFAFDFHDDPVAFLAGAAALLDARPLESTVVATVSARIARGAGVEQPDGAPPRWWVVVREGDRVVGAGMRTAPFLPFPVYLLAMPDEAAIALARLLHARGEHLDGVAGDAAAADACAAETARLTGRVVRVSERMSLQEVVAVIDPSEPPGSFRRARPAEVDLLLPWLDAFNADAAEQAGAAHPHPGPIESRESTLARIENGEVWVWETDAGPVHLAAYNPPASGVARIGPVYTPKEHRGHGYAAAAVARLSRQLLGTGARVCLFVDEQNPVSYALYARLGFEPVATTTNLFVVDG